MKTWLIRTAYTMMFDYHVRADTEQEAKDKFGKEFILPIDEYQSETDLVSIWDITDAKDEKEDFNWFSDEDHSEGDTK